MQKRKSQTNHILVFFIINENSPMSSLCYYFEALASFQNPPGKEVRHLSSLHDLTQLSSCPVVIGSLLFGWCLRLDCTTCLPYDGSVQTAPQPLSGALCVLCRSQTILLLSQENRDILPASIFGLNTLNYDRQRKEPYWSCVKIKKTTMHSVNGKSTKNVFIDGWKQITSTSNMIEL